MVNFKRVAENKCEICNQDFTHKRHHKKQKKFQCEICSKYFTQSSNLNVHVRTVHQKLTQTSAINGYKCRILMPTKIKIMDS
jgi:stress-induced morphogen